MTDLEILIAAKAKIADPKNWTKGVLARGKSGRPVKPKGRAAICFCALGALHKVSEKSIWNAAVYLHNASVERGTIYVNDTLGHAAVMALYDRAIEIAKRKYTSHDN